MAKRGKQVHVKREVRVYTVRIDRKPLEWEIRETRTRRWQCYDHYGVCIAWSFNLSKAIEKLKQELDRWHGQILYVHQTHRMIAPDMRKNRDR